MKFIIRKIALIITVFSIGFFSLATSPAFAETDVCKILESGSAAYEANGCGDDTEDSFRKLIINIINVVMSIIALIAVIAIIIGGTQYMTSTGDPGKVKKAKDTIMYAVIGLIITILAAVIVNFVISGLVTKSTT